MTLEPNGALRGPTVETPANGADALAVPADFRALFEGMSALCVVFAPDAPRFTILAATDAYCRAVRVTREEIVGRSPSDMFADTAPDRPGGLERRAASDIGASLREVLRTRAPHRPPVLRWDVVGQDGRAEVRYWQPLHTPVLGADGAVRYILHQVEDVTEAVLDREAVAAAERRAERILERVSDAHVPRDHERLLTELKRAEAALRESEARLAEVFRQAPVAVAVLRGRVARDLVFELVNPRYEEIIPRGRRPLGRRLEDVLPEMDAELLEVLQRVLDTGEPFVASDYPASLDRDGDGTPETYYFNFVYHPLVEADGAVVGIVGVGAEVTESVLARRAAERLQQAAEAARVEAEAARQRIAFLAEASERLARSLDVEATLQTVAELAVPALADWCFVEVRGEDGAIRPVAVAHPDPAMVAHAYDVLRRYPIDPDAPFGTGHVLRTGEPELVPDIADEMLVAVAQDAEHLGLVRAVGFRSSLSVPLRDAEGRPVAVLSLMDAQSGRRFGTADLAMAEEVARRAEAALARAHLHAAQQAALRRANALHRVTAALSGTLTAGEAAAAVVEQIAGALNARGGVVVSATKDGAALEVVRGVGYAKARLDAWREIPMDAPVPLAEAARTREPVFVESVTAWEARYGKSGLLQQLPGACSWAALPLVLEGRVLGAMGLTFAREGSLDAEDRAFALALAQQCAQAFERARLFDAERAARNEAEAANRAKSEFLAVMSHELRTPLNAIAGYAELMEMGIQGPVTPEQRVALGRIRASERHLLGLINEVLNYARLETGAVRYEVATVAIRDALAGAEALVSPQARAKGLTLTSTHCPPELTAYADAEKLRQALVNLLSNAVKFTDRGGRVELACEARDDRVAIIVRDTGIGIAADQLERIFEPFVQVRADLTRTAEGTGLGLAISRDLARGMGGDLAAESTPGAGSTFTLTLPRA